MMEDQNNENILKRIIKDVEELNNYDILYREFKQSKRSDQLIENIQQTIEKVQVENYELFNEDKYKQNMKQLNLQKAKEFMIELLKKTKICPLIIWYIQINQNGYKIKINNDLIIMIQKDIDYGICYGFWENLEMQQFVESNRFSNILFLVLQRISNNVQQLISFKMIDNQYLNQIKYLFEQSQNIDVQKLNNNNKKIFNVIKELYNKISSINFMELDVSKHKSKIELLCEELLKALLYFSNFKMIAHPAILKYLSYKTKKSDVEVRQIIIHPSKSLLKILVQRKELRDVVYALSIPQFLFKEQSIEVYIQEYQNNVMNCFSFLKQIKIDKIISKQIQILSNNWIEYKEDLIEIYKNKQFQGLLQRLKMYNKLEINSETFSKDLKSFYSITQYRYIKVTRLLSSLKNSLQEFQHISSSNTQLNGDSDYDDYAKIEDFKKCLIFYNFGPSDYRIINIFKNFIYEATLNNLPFPRLFTLISFSFYKFGIGLSKQKFDELLQDKLFINFLYSKFGGQISSNQKKQEIKKTLLQFDSKKISNWPKSILRQAKIIYEKRQTIQESIIDMVAHSQFQKFLQDMKEANEQNELRREVLNYITQIQEYAMNIKI